MNQSWMNQRINSLLKSLRLRTHRIHSVTTVVWHKSNFTRFLLPLGKGDKADPQLVRSRMGHSEPMQDQFRTSNKRKCFLCSYPLTEVTSAGTNARQMNFEGNKGNSYKGFFGQISSQFHRIQPEAAGQESPGRVR